MHEASILVSRPQHATQLVLLFHGVGSSAPNLVPLGEAIALRRRKGNLAATARAERMLAELGP